jgi:hypothetical protein
MSYEEEDTCHISRRILSYEEEDTCMSYEEEDTCHTGISHLLTMRPDIS